MQIVETDIQKEIRFLARKFAQTELKAIVEQDDREAKFRPELIGKLGELGLTGIAVPEAWGGAGLGYLEYITAIEEFAAVHSTYGISVGVTGLCQNVILNFGSDAQKKKYIPPLATGKHIGAFALSEAASGSDAAGLRTTAKKQGNEYILNGAKLWITQADVANILIVMARTSEDKTKGISTFILEKNTPGLSMGKQEDKMGLSASHTMEVVLENAKVPAENLIGSEGDGFKIALTSLDSGRITIGAGACGLARGALEVALSHASEREQFGKKIGTFQGVAFMLADMKTQLDAARGLVRRAAWRKDQGLNYTTEASQAKYFSTDMAMQVTTDAVQVLGGSGYTKDFPVERFMREAKVMQIFEGTNQIQRLITGKNTLKCFQEGGSLVE